MAKSPRIVFMGTPDFAVATLDALVNANYNIVGVITAPDKPAGRGKKIQESAVKKYADNKDLKVLQPTNLKDEQFVNTLSDLKADIQIVVAFRMLPEVVWNMPPQGTINLHASLLPHYRGAAPINWAIINGEKESGVSTFFIEKEIDTGNIILQEKVNISKNMSAGELHDQLMEVGASLMVKTIKKVTDGNVVDIAQSDVLKGKEPKLAPKIFKEDCQISWNEPAQRVYNLIRGLSPYPAAWTEMELKSGEKVSVKIYETAIYSSEEGSFAPGSIETDGKKFLNVSCKDGWISIQRLQMAGKKQMRTEDFLRGFDVIEKVNAFC